MLDTENKPLSGILVIALEQAVAAPFCTSRLADAGARVIKIERASGDFARGYDDVVHGESSYFVWLNRGKESIILDIKNTEDAALLGRMISKADIFVQNLAPGASARAGFGSTSLRKQQSNLITCDISGYDPDGPSREMKSYDMLVQAETGLASITGSPQEPGRVGVSVCDIAAGMYAHSAILLALLERQSTGDGKSISCSLFDGMADWMAVPLLHHDYGGKAPDRVGLRHPSVAPYTAFETKDGEKIVISIQNDREWSIFAENILRRPDLTQDPRFENNISRVENLKDLETEIAQVFKNWNAEYMYEQLKEFGIAFGRLNSVKALSEHSDLRRVSVEVPRGSANIPAPPAKIDEDIIVLGSVPELGQHTETIRQEFK